MVDTNNAHILNAEGIYLAAIGILLSSSPAHEQISQLASEELFSIIPFAGEQEATQKGVSLLMEWAEDYDESQLDSLRFDYMQLFEGPGMPKAPLWESVYTNKEGHLVFQEETLHVRQWFKAYDLQVPNLYKEPDDSIAFELQFVGHLTQRAAEEVEAQDFDKAQKLLSDRARFCREHLLLWGLEWCELVHKEAKTAYYQGLAYLVEGILSELKITGSEEQ
jgi:TorA maturation chaperone TorD